MLLMLRLCWLHTEECGSIMRVILCHFWSHWLTCLTDLFVQLSPKYTSSHETYIPKNVLYKKHNISKIKQVKFLEQKLQGNTWHEIYRVISGCGRSHYAQVHLQIDRILFAPDRNQYSLPALRSGDWAKATQHQFQGKKAQHRRVIHAPDWSGLQECCPVSN